MTTATPGFAAVSLDDSLSKRRAARALLLILLAGLVVRLALLWWWYDRPLQIYDERDYHRLATSILEHGEYAYEPGSPTSARPPLYPAVVAGTYYLADRIAGLPRIDAVRILQAGLGLWLVVQVYQLAAGMYSRRVGLGAAAIAAFYPSLLGFAHLLLSDLLFAVLLMQALLALQRHWRQPSLLMLAACGGLLALATLTRSVLWPFFPVMAVYLFIASRRETLQRRSLYAIVPVAAFILVLAPWAVRNTRLQETFVPVDVLGGRNMMMGNYEHTAFYRSWATISVVEPEQQWDRLLVREHEGYRKLTQGQRDKLAMRRGFEYALAHPVQTLNRDVVKFFNFWQIERTLVAGLLRGWWGGSSRPVLVLAAVLIVGSYAAVQLVGIYGFAVLPPRDRRLHWFLLTVTLFVCAVHTVVFAHSRYHLSLMPLVFPYASAAMLRWRDIWHARSRTAFRVATVISVVLVASWFWQALWVDLRGISETPATRAGASIFTNSPRTP